MLFPEEGLDAKAPIDIDHQATIVMNRGIRYSSIMHCNIGLDMTIWNVKALATIVQHQLQQPLYLRVT